MTSDDAAHQISETVEQAFQLVEKTEYVYKLLLEYNTGDAKLVQVAKKQHDDALAAHKAAVARREKTNANRAAKIPGNDLLPTLQWCVVSALLFDEKRCQLSQDILLSFSCISSRSRGPR